MGFDIDAIVPIDYVSPTGSIRDIVPAIGPFDYAIASHVIEHVPDLIEWLGDIRAILRDRGVLSLAIPDHRRCFDALRSPTVTAEVIQAHVSRATVPSPRQVFDHYSCAVAWRGAIAWEQDVAFGELTSIHTEVEALERATAVATTGEYVDVHCWVFTPSSFAHLFAALQRMQLVPFSLEHCSDTVGGEFFATLRAVDPASATVDQPLADVGLPATASEHARVRSELMAVQADFGPVSDQLRRTLASRSWTVNGPLRAFNRLRACRR